MKSKKIFKGTAHLLLVFSLVMSLSSVASAANYYGIVTTSDSIDGTYFYARTQDMDSKWTSTTSGQYRFILHTTWIQSAASSGTKWIEVGFVDGAMAEPGSTVSYHNGFYTATGSYDTYGNLASYAEYIITGPSTAVGTGHNYQVQRTGTDDWGVYVDYTLYHTYNDFATSCDGTDVGLETNYAYSTSDQWNERAFQVLKNGSWSAWSSGSIKREDSSQGISVDWDTSPTSIFTEKT